MEDQANNSLDQYSKPLKQESSGLATVFWLNARGSKKGRLFIPVYDERSPLEFPVRYAYLSSFLEEGNISGNHYHRIKQEILIPLQGEFDIDLEDIEAKTRETISVNGGENKAVYLRTGIAHRVVSKGKTGIVLVLASHHSTAEDEIEYAVER